MKFFDNYDDFYNAFANNYSKFWNGAGYYWIDSKGEISYSVVDTRLENVPFSTVPKCEVCDALGEICPACGDDEAIPTEKI